MPKTVVKTNPCGLLGEGEIQRATNPVMRLKTTAHRRLPAPLHAGREPQSLWHPIRNPPSPTYRTPSEPLLIARDWRKRNPAAAARLAHRRGGYSDPERSVEVGWW